MAQTDVHHGSNPSVMAGITPRVMAGLVPATHVLRIAVAGKS
jgi:hypothetical protein